jgi:hypothetical protein
MPQFQQAQQAGKRALWVKKSAEVELRFETVAQPQNFNLKPLYQIADERYSVYWQEMSKA